MTAADEPRRPQHRPLPRNGAAPTCTCGQWDDENCPEHHGRNRPAPEPAPKKSVATALVDLAAELYEFGVSTSGEPFAIPRGGPRVAAMLRGGKLSLRPLLAKAYFERTGRAAGAQGIADALLILEGRAHAAGEQELALRVATAADGALWVDLGDHTGRAVRIDGTGWTVEPGAPMLFRRSALTGPLPVPARGGDLGELWALLNVADDDRPLVLAWLVAALIDSIPHPVLALTGEQGTGKTTATKVIVGLVDPSPVPARKSPRDVEAWVTAAAGSWVVGIDNLSGIPPWFSDSLCRAVTGDGDVRRQLYTDGDLVVFSFRRAVVANGIDLGSLRGDLADRLLPIALDLIADTARRDEQALWPAWAAAHPRILGALLDLASGVLARLPSVELASKPRMADFARVVAAVDQVLGAEGLARYLAKQGTLAADVIEGDLFAAALVATVTRPFAGISRAVEARRAGRAWRRAPPAHRVAIDAEAGDIGPPPPRSGAPPGRVGRHR